MAEADTRTRKTEPRLDTKQRKDDSRPESKNTTGKQISDGSRQGRCIDRRGQNPKSTDDRKRVADTQPFKWSAQYSCRHRVRLLGRDGRSRGALGRVVVAVESVEELASPATVSAVPMQPHRCWPRLSPRYLGSRTLPHRCGQPSCQTSWLFRHGVCVHTVP